MKVLVLLADQRGEVVTRDELIERCWDGRYVSDDVVNRSILLLRRIAKSSSAFTIETVPKAGYRLTEIEGQQAPSRRWPLWSAAAATAILSVAAIFMLRGPADQSHPPLAAIELAPFVAAGDPLAGETAKASDTAVADMLANSGLPVLRPRAAGSQGQSGRPAPVGPIAFGRRSRRSQPAARRSGARYLAAVAPIQRQPRPGETPARADRCVRRDLAGDHRGADGARSPAAGRPPPHRRTAAPVEHDDRLRGCGGDLPVGRPDRRADAGFGNRAAGPRDEHRPHAAPACQPRNDQRRWRRGGRPRRVPASWRPAMATSRSPTAISTRRRDWTVAKPFFARRSRPIRPRRSSQPRCATIW